MSEEPDDFGSGYASYKALWCFAKNGRGISEVGHGRNMDGLQVFLCKLGPFAVWGGGNQFARADGQGGSSSFLGLESLYVPPAGEWGDVIMEVERILGRHGFELPTREVLERALPEDVRVATLWDPPHRVFDAVFHWCD